MNDDLLLTASLPQSLEEFRAAGGGHGIVRAREVGRDQILEELAWAGLRGRGGAGFPTASKWRTVLDAPATARYLVCNAAEGEPGTYKDRWLMRQNPWLVLEGVAMAAETLGAQRAYIATKSRFLLENAALESALVEMTAAGMLGDIPIDIVPGPDRYLFGEEKAMLEVIEGREPLPRLLPPYQVGLFARPGSANPTVVNNVTTLAHAGLIARDGGCRFRHVGTSTSPGTMLFTISGDVQEPGVHELPLGTPFAELLERAGGPRPSRRIKAAFPGASSGVIPGEQFDVPLSYEGLSDIGSGLGSGGFVLYDDEVCIVAATAILTRFLADESCAQCPACKQGAIAITDVLDEIEAGAGELDHLATIRGRARSVTGGARCGLPKGTAAVAASVLDHFEDEFRDHLGTTCNGRAPVMPMLTASEDAPGGFVPLEPRPAASSEAAREASHVGS